MAYAIVIIGLSILHGYHTLEKYISQQTLLYFIIAASIFTGLYVLSGIIYITICYCFSQVYQEMEKDCKRFGSNPPYKAKSIFYKGL